MALLTDMTHDEKIKITVDDVHISMRVIKKSGTKVRVRIEAPKDKVGISKVIDPMTDKEKAEVRL